MVYVVHDPELHVRVWALASPLPALPAPPPVIVWLVVDKMRSRFPEPQWEQTNSTSSSFFITRISRYWSQSMHLNSYIGIFVSLEKMLAQTGHFLSIVNRLIGGRCRLSNGTFS
jgi:hypothetical protein